MTDSASDKGDVVHTATDPQTDAHALNDRRTESRYSTLLKLRDAVEAVQLALADPGAFRVWIVAQPASWAPLRRACTACPIADYLRDASSLPGPWTLVVTGEWIEVIPPVPTFVGYPADTPGGYRLRTPRWVRRFLVEWDRAGAPARGTRGEVLRILDSGGYC